MEAHRRLWSEGNARRQGDSCTDMPSPAGSSATSEQIHNGDLGGPGIVSLEMPLSNVWLSAEPLLQVNAHAEASTDKQGRDLSCSDPRGGCCKIPSDPQRMCVLCPPTHARRTRPLSAPPAAASRLKTLFLLPVQNPSNNVLHH